MNTLLISRPVREGYILSSQDFKAGELITHSQSCIWIVGKSDLAVALLNKVDPHAAFAATMLGIDLKDFDKKIKKHNALRQAGKPFNFSKPGGGGVPTIIMQQRKGGEDTPHPDGPSMISDGKGGLQPGFKGMRFCTVMHGEYCGGYDGKQKTRTWGSRGRERSIAPTCSMCLECGRELEAVWKRQWSENEGYFAFITDCLKNGMVITAKMIARWPWLAGVYQPGQRLQPEQIMQHWSGRLRKVGRTAETPFCVLANTMFQALLADITKLAHRIVTRECYDHTVRVPSMLFENSLISEFAGMPSPLYGSRIPIFAHDELIGEHPASIAHEASTRISEIMRDCMRYVCPDLADAAEAEPTLMPAWYKSASKVVHNGRLVPWTPDHNEKTCGECVAERMRHAT